MLETLLLCGKDLTSPSDDFDCAISTYIHQLKSNRSIDVSGLWNTLLHDHHWHWLSSVHTCRPCCSTLLMKHYHSNFVAV